MQNSATLWQRLSVLALGAALVSGSAILLRAQRQSGSQLPSAQPETNDAWEQQQRKAMAKAANQQRQDDIRKDAAQLLELATELKQSVDKTTENTLSLDVVKKAEKIEKLAKAVKEKMKGP
jgi:hypothetical protein